jgi:methanethiol S-methyltransferase
MSKAIALVYGVVCYVMFLIVILYTIGFVEDLVVSKTIDSGETAANLGSVVTDLMLLGIFAIQHSVMARQEFKVWWTQFVPRSVERSTYVLFANLAVILLLWKWQPLPAVVWSVENPAFAQLLVILSFAGWATVFLSTFLINHFDLFGLKQVIDNISGHIAREQKFYTPFLYKFVRHPLYLGFLIAFWATPLMTMGHLLFAVATTAYIFIGIALEERDLIAHFGDTYLDYRARVSMIVPMLPKRLEPGE